MCFSKGIKVPKPSKEVKAPEPVLLEPPKGVEFGDGPDDTTNQDATPSKGIGSLKVAKTGDGSQTAVASDTGISKTTKGGAIKRAMNKT